MARCWQRRNGCLELAKQSLPLLMYLRCWPGAMPSLATGMMTAKCNGCALRALNCCAATGSWWPRAQWPWEDASTGPTPWCWPGSIPVLPQIPGLAEAQAWGTREATAAKKIPPRLAIIGGGVAAVEMAFAFNSLGSAVTVLSRGALLSREEPFAGQMVAAALEEQGVEVRIGATPSKVSRDAQGIVHLDFAEGSAVAADELLVATGRRANTSNLGLEAVDLDPAAIDVDDTLRVSGTDWLYVVGDANGRGLLTHQGKYQARVTGEAIAARLSGAEVQGAKWGRHAATADHGAIPRVVFTDPQVAAVGLTEHAARSQGLGIKVIEHDLGAIAGASLHADGYTGRAKLVIDRERGVILGASFVGQDAAELLHAATVAIIGEVPLERLWHAVPAYPTVSEICLRLLETERFG